MWKLLRSLILCTDAEEDFEEASIDAGFADEAIFLP
jgi:hypothetical protein